MTVGLDRAVMLKGELRAPPFVRAILDDHGGNSRAHAQPGHVVRESFAVGKGERSRSRWPPVPVRFREGQHRE